MKKKVLLILTVLWTAFIFFNSAQIGDDSASMSGFFVGIAKKMLSFVGIVNIDTENLSYAVRKAAHFTEFFVQSALLSAFIIEIKKKYGEYIIYALFTGLLTACCDELLQMFVEGRGSAVLDVFIDFSGTVLAAAVILTVIFLKKHFTKLN